MMLKVWWRSLAETPPIEGHGVVWACVQSLQVNRSGDTFCSFSFSKPAFAPYIGLTFRDEYVFPRCLCLWNGERASMAYDINWNYGVQATHTHEDYMVETSVSEFALIRLLDNLRECAHAELYQSHHAIDRWWHSPRADLSELFLLLFSLNDGGVFRSNNLDELKRWLSYRVLEPLPEPPRARKRKKTPPSGASA